MLLVVAQIVIRDQAPRLRGLSKVMENVPTVDQPSLVDRGEVLGADRRRGEWEEEK